MVKLILLITMLTPLGLAVAVAWMADNRVVYILMSGYVSLQVIMAIFVLRNAANANN